MSRGLRTAENLEKPWTVPILGLEKWTGGGLALDKSEVVVKDNSPVASWDGNHTL